MLFFCCNVKGCEVYSWVVMRLNLLSAILLFFYYRSVGKLWCGILPLIVFKIYSSILPLLWLTVLGIIQTIMSYILCDYNFFFLAEMRRKTFFVLLFPNLRQEDNIHNERSTQLAAIKKEICNTFRGLLWLPPSQRIGDTTPSVCVH